MHTVRHFMKVFKFLYFTNSTAKLTRHKVRLCRLFTITHFYKGHWKSDIKVLPNCKGNGNQILYEGFVSVKKGGV